MQKAVEDQVPRTTTDIVFDQLFEEISSLKLLPGSRISEAEVASRLGVSRQPVRDAFNRLGNLGLLLIRPQRATEVRGFSLDVVQNARFIRLSVELEVVERACGVWDDTRAKVLSDNLALQRLAVADDDTERFHELDYEFHRLICELGGVPLAFDTIEQCKRPIDRLCVLSLVKHTEAFAILEDHQDIIDALASKSVDQARAKVRHHLARLDDTISNIHTAHSEFFE